MAIVPPQILDRLAPLGLVPSAGVWGTPVASDLPNQGTLQLGLGPLRGRREAGWIGRSLWWTPQTRETNRPWYAIVSSRLGRHPERRAGWFRLLERAIAEAARDRAAIVVAEGTAAEPWVKHACGLFRIPITRLRIAPPSGSLAAWLEELRTAPRGGAPGDDETVIDVSPPFDGGWHAAQQSPEARASGRRAASLRRDCAAVGLSDRLFALHVRDRGRLESLLLRRIAEDADHPERVRVGVHPRPRESARRLVEAGAVGAFVSGTETPSCAASLPHSGAVRAASEPAEILTLQELLARRRDPAAPDRWPYLVHCTREPTGPWPDQTLRQYHDELALGVGENRSGPLAALMRILRQQVLWNSARLVRGRQGVVCWSAVPLPDLLQRRTYRSHLGRWDYEPYGIGIDRTHLARFGALPVRYGTAEAGERLAAGERLFFQPTGDRYDWRQEREWRIAQPVRLVRVPAEAAFVFVPTLEAAKRIAPLSRWPVVVAPSIQGGRSR